MSRLVVVSSLAAMFMFSACGVKESEVSKYRKSKVSEQGADSDDTDRFNGNKDESSSDNDSSNGNDSTGGKDQDGSSADSGDSGSGSGEVTALRQEVMDAWTTGVDGNLPCSTCHDDFDLPTSQTVEAFKMNIASDQGNIKFNHEKAGLLSGDQVQVSDSWIEEAISYIAERKEKANQF
ncbi:hypothetical protein [Pseudobacteriovorax antillogorgiicola]|uniref:Cytochrome c domain-containing protein n=1 Tax=Pseudobacteriovorax antillogorgiicola TaxID=1513793 RepID=A0A1Y6CJD1_9BACT|nr:hypothetical protein [Pseudobacteriovorax antillogorgiicola]TCS48009.1 hypothetical protein EDD56_119120 [Pseudobacteriovorax antillogorgiicola]SMF58545.1 hypothetical protein SAMN06296036_119121 [Pseudobacteriovorax antillogorgiicola]